MTSLFPLSFAGRVEARRFESAALRGNPLGDSAEREVPVYLPPAADGPLPVVFLLAGFTGRHEMRSFVYTLAKTVLPPTS